MHISSFIISTLCTFLQSFAIYIAYVCKCLWFAFSMFASLFNWRICRNLQHCYSFQRLSFVCININCFIVKLMQICDDLCKSCSCCHVLWLFFFLIVCRMKISLIIVVVFLVVVFIVGNGACFYWKRDWFCEKGKVI